MSCPDGCALQFQSQRAVLPHYRAPILGRYEKSHRKPVENAIPVSVHICTTCGKQWSKVEQNGVARWTDAISDGSFRGS